MPHALRVALTALAALALLVAGSLFQRWLPDQDADPGAEPHVRSGEVGEPVDLRTAVVTVDEVTGSGSLDEYGTEQESPGVWVVASYTVVAKDEDTPVTFAELRDDRGRVLGLVGRNANDCMASPPGVEAHCTAAFEVPPDALPSLVLRLARESRDIRYDVVAEVDLGLTAADADEFADAAPLVVPPSSLGDAS